MPISGEKEFKSLAFMFGDLFMDYLNDSLRDRKWLEGIIMSTALFEFVGKERLRTHFAGKINASKFDHLNLQQIIMFLYGSGIIDEVTYSKMEEIRKDRNRIVHGDLSKLKPEKAQKLIAHAIDCLEVMFNVE